MKRLKSLCKTSSQRKAFNRLLSTFATGSLAKDSNILKCILPIRLTNDILLEGCNLIDNNSLVHIDKGSIKGRECHPHISVLLDFFNDPAIKDRVKESLPIEATISEIGWWYNGDNGYYIWRFLIDSPELIKLHNDLVSEFNIQDKYPDYNPHITLGYTKSVPRGPIHSSLVGRKFTITQMIIEDHKVIGEFS